ncbi:hypothetical protein VH98_08790 [Acinetobacter brisouii]|nr:hypothetical protein VH98_08790 [Acinetobacter brisouii]
MYESTPDKKKINNQAVNHIISLGDHCFTSFLLKNAGLKKYSLPFDWIFSSPEVIQHCINDDFFQFLNKSQYISTYNTSNEPSSNHLFYEKNYNIKNMFNHADVTVNDNYEYTIRTVERFRKLLKSDETKLFILIGRIGSNIGESFDALSNILTEKTNNAALLAIQLQNPTLESGCSELTKIINNGSHNLYNYRSSSYENGLIFKDRSDELQILRLISAYELDLKNRV